MHSARHQSGNLPRLARELSRPDHLLWRPGAAAPIAVEIPHDWLREHVNYYEEVEADHRAKDPLLKALKKRIRLQLDKVKCREIRKALQGCLWWERFMEAWKSCNPFLTQY